MNTQEAELRQALKDTLHRRGSTTSPIGVKVVLDGEVLAERVVGAHTLSCLHLRRQLQAQGKPMRCRASCERLNALVAKVPCDAETYRLRLLVAEAHEFDQQGSGVDFPGAVLIVCECGWYMHVQVEDPEKPFSEGVLAFHREHQQEMIWGSDDDPHR